MGYPLDPSPEQMREMGQAALEYVVGFVATRDDAPATRFEHAVEAAEAHRASPPETGGGIAPPPAPGGTTAENTAATAAPGVPATTPSRAQCRSSPPELPSTTVDR